MAFRNRKKNYPLYETTHFRDFREMVENAADRFADRPAFHYKDKPNDPEIRKITFCETRDIVRAVASEMYDRGIEGKKVAILGGASVDWFLSYFALMCVGAVTVPVDKELPPEDIASILNTAECSYIFYASASREKVEKLRPIVPSLFGFVEFGEAADFAEPFDSLVR